MADVIPWDDGAGNRSRAQLLLVGALALAVVFLSLSLLLNSVIYTENLATRGTHAEIEQTETFRFAVVDSLGGAIEHANRNDSADFAARHDDYRNVTGALIPTLANYSATDGLTTEVERRDVHEGTRIVDTDASTSLTPRDGSTANWTLATDARVRNFRLHLDVANLSNTVTIAFDNGTTREVIVDGGANELRVGGSGPACDLSEGRIDVSGARVDGEYCHALSTLPLDDEVTVTVENGDRVAGTYSLVVDRHEPGLRTAADASNYPGQCAPPSPPTYDTSDAGDPYTTPAVYAATANVSVRTDDLDYRRSVRAAPGEAGDPATEPTFARFDVSNTSTSLTVDWNATDPNDDVDRVEVGLYNVTAGATEVAPSNESAVGSVTFSGLSNDSAYAVNATAVDASSTRRVSAIHSPDGGGGCPP